MFASGCGALSNQEVFRDAKKCVDAGMVPIEMRNGLTGAIYAVTCITNDQHYTLVN